MSWPYTSPGHCWIDDPGGVWALESWHQWMRAGEVDLIFANWQKQESWSFPSPGQSRRDAPGSIGKQESLWANQHSYHSGLGPELWVGPSQYLYYLWTVGACEAANSARAPRHRTATGYPLRGALVRIQYSWYNRNKKPKTRPMTHYSEHV